jgi:hypothetical protein
MLRDATKVDLIFVAETMEERPPWRSSPESLAQIDAHFWDWILWLAQKTRGGKTALVTQELAKMHGYLLAPLGVTRPPRSIADALHLYRTARGEREREFDVSVPRDLERAVQRRLQAAGVV